VSDAQKAFKTRINYLGFRRASKHLGNLKNFEDSGKFCAIDTLILLHHLA
jgi:hypothetical protein